MSNDKPTGEWAKQQKEGIEKQEADQKPSSVQKHDQGGAGEPATSDLEPEKDGGIAGP